MRIITLVLGLFTGADILLEAEALMRRGIGVVEKMADAMEKSAHAKEAQGKLEPLVAEYRALKKNAEALGLEKADKERLHRKLEPELRPALEKFLKASIKLAGRDPRGFKQLPAVFDGLYP